MHIQVEYYEQEVLGKEPVDPFSDFARIARMLTGNRIGLVLGGGGARYDSLTLPLSLWLIVCKIRLNWMKQIRGYGGWVGVGIVVDQPED